MTISPEALKRTVPTRESQARTWAPPTEILPAESFPKLSVLMEKYNAAFMIYQIQDSSTGKGRTPVASLALKKPVRVYKSPIYPHT